MGNVWVLLGENCFWSLLALKGLIITGTCFTLFAAILYPFFIGKNNGQISHLKKCYPTLLQKKSSLWVLLHIKIIVIPLATHTPLSLY